MKDYLLDIVKHTHALGFIDLVKISGTKEETILEGLADDRSVVIKAKFKQPYEEFNGTFGMPNLNKLNILLGLSEYQEEAKISIRKQERNDEITPVGLYFENASGDFKNDYRFMTSEVVDDKIKATKFKGASWNVEFAPSLAALQRLKMQAQVHSEETTFVAKTEGDDLKFYFGDHSTHAGNFVFETDIKGMLSEEWNWPIQQVISILSLPGEITMKFSDKGAAMITVDSGMIVYEYILPAQTK